jgi:hypothetical protein
MWFLKTDGCRVLESSSSVNEGMQVACVQELHGTLRWREDQCRRRIRKILAVRRKGIKVVNTKFIAINFKGVQHLRQHDEFSPSLDGVESTGFFIDSVETFKRDGDVRNLHPVFDGSTTQVELHDATVKGISHVLTVQTVSPLLLS